MGFVDTILELCLVALLGLTLVHAIRLQRAIGALRSERASLDDAVAGFDNGARQAEAGLSRLREQAHSLGREITQASALKDDLAFLMERGDQVADRLDTLVRAARGADPAARKLAAAAHDSPPRSQAERDLLQALRGAR